MTQDSSPGGRSEYRFSLRGLFVFVFGCAIGLSIANLDGPTWGDGVLATVATWCLLGFFHEIRDLWHARNRKTLDHAEQIWGWRMAVSWRLGIVGVFALLFIIQYLDAFGWLKPDDDLWLGAYLREPTLVLCILILIYRPSHYPSVLSKWPLASRAYCILGWTALGLMGLWICIHQTMIPFLVHTAIRGIRAAMPLHFVDGTPNPEAYINIRPAVDRLWWNSLFVAGVVPVNVILACQLARQWNRGNLRRVLVSLGLCVGLGVTAAHVVWIYAVAFPHISPELAANPARGHWDRWLFAAILVVIFTTVCAIRLLSFDDNGKPVFTEEWKRNEWRYHHQHRFVLGFLCVMCLILSIMRLVDWHPVPLNSFQGILDSLVFLFTSDPAGTLLLAILLVSLRGLFRKRNARTGQLETGPLVLSPWQFTAVWLVTLLTIATSVTTLYWFGFSVWLVS